MARLLQVFFHINHIGREGRFGFRTGHGIGLLDVVVAEGDFHAFAAAAVFGFDNDGITDFMRPFFGVFQSVERRRTRGDRNAGFDRCLAGGDFVAHFAHLRRGRADEGDAVFLDHFGKVRVFGKEAETGVNGVRAGDQSGGNNRRLVKVGVD